MSSGSDFLWFDCDVKRLAHASSVFSRMTEASEDNVLTESRRSLYASAAERMLEGISFLESGIVPVYFIGRVGVGKTSFVSAISGLYRSRENYERFVLSRWEEKQARLVERLEDLEKKEASRSEGLPSYKSRIMKVRADIERHFVQKKDIRPYSFASAEVLLMPVGPGRTTLCRTSVEYGLKPRVSVSPVSRDKFLDIVSLVVSGLAEESSDDIASREVVRALANMCSLKVSDFEGLVAAGVAEGLSETDICQRIFHLSGYDSRSVVDFVCPDDEDVESWISRILLGIHMVSISDVVYPESVSVFWPRCPKGVRFFDLRGLDGDMVTPSPEIVNALLDQNGCHIFCAPFESAPGAEIERVLRYRRDVLGLNSDVSVMGMGRGPVSANTDIVDVADSDGFQEGSPIFFSSSDVYESKCYEIASILDRRFAMRSPIICCGDVCVDFDFFRDLVSFSVRRCHEEISARLFSDVEDGEKLLSEVWDDEIFLRPVMYFFRKFLLSSVMDIFPQPQDLSSGIPKTVPAIRLWAVVRRYGIFEPIYVPSLLSDRYAQVLDRLFSIFDAKLDSIFGRVRDQLAERGFSSELVDPCRKMILEAYSSWKSQVRLSFRRRMDAFAVRFLTSDPVGRECFERCQSFWGGEKEVKAEVKALGGFRAVVLDEMNKLSFSFHRDFASDLANRIWKTAREDFVRMTARLPEDFVPDCDFSGDEEPVSLSKLFESVESSRSEPSVGFDEFLSRQRSGL